MVQPFSRRKTNGSCAEIYKERIPNLLLEDPLRRSTSSKDSKTDPSSAFNFTNGESYLSYSAISSAETSMRTYDDVSYGRRSQIQSDEASLNSRQDSVANTSHGSLARNRSQRTPRRLDTAHLTNFHVRSRSPSPYSGSVASSQLASISSNLSANAPIFHISAGKTELSSHNQTIRSEGAEYEPYQRHAFRGTKILRDSPDEESVEYSFQLEQLVAPSQLDLSFVQKQQSSNSAMPNEAHIPPSAAEQKTLFTESSSGGSFPFPGFISPIKLSQSRKKSPRTHDKKCKSKSTDTTDSASLTSLSRQSSTYKSTISSSIASLSRQTALRSSSLRPSSAESSSLIQALQGLDVQSEDKNDILFNIPYQLMSDRSAYSRRLDQYETFPSILPARVATANKNGTVSDPDVSDPYQDVTVLGPLVFQSSYMSVKGDWLLEMNEKLRKTPIGELNPEEIAVSSIMNGWAKTKTSKGAKMVEMWLRRVEAEEKAGNQFLVLSNKMFTIAVDAWAKR